MNNTIITVAGVAVVGYGIAGIVFFIKAGTKLAVNIENREFSFYSGITCATISALILIVGLLATRKNQ